MTISVTPRCFQVERTKRPLLWWGVPTIALLHVIVNGANQIYWILLISGTFIEFSLLRIQRTHQRFDAKQTAEAMQK